MNKHKIQQAIALLNEALGQKHTETSRFTGEPTEYFGRVMPEAQTEIEKWKNPSDEYRAKGGKNIEYLIKGAADVDNKVDYHVFFENEDQFNSLSPEIQKLMRKNMNRYTGISNKRCQMFELVDFNNRIIPGHYVWNFGHYTLFDDNGREKNREDVISDMMDVKSSIFCAVESESQKHKPWPPKG